MAHDVGTIKSDNANVTLINEAIEAVLEITPEESYPSGRGGYSDSHIRALARDLAPHDVELQYVTRGNAVTVAVANFAAVNASDENVAAVRAYAVQKLREYGRSFENNRNRKNRLRQAIKRLNAPRVVYDNYCLVCCYVIDGVPVGEYTPYIKYRERLLDALA